MLSSGREGVSSRQVAKPKKKKHAGSYVPSEDERPLLPALEGYVTQSGVNPGFKPVPWTPRRETTAMNGVDRGMGKYTPSHLHVFTEEERDPAHYPHAQRGADGEPNKFCWACGRPVTSTGISGKTHRGVGKPCPACGFRRKQASTPGQRAQLEKNRQRQHIVRDELVALGLGANGRRGMRKETRVSDVMTAWAHKEAAKILAPYVEALELQPREGWSPTTTLEFYSNQVAVAEKLLDRVEGKPVNRNRHVDSDDNDVLRDDELSPATLAQLVAAIATGADTEALLGEVVEEGEWEDTNPEEGS